MPELSDQIAFYPEGIPGPRHVAIVVGVHGVDCLTVFVPDLNETFKHINFYQNDSNLPPKARHTCPWKD